MQNKVDWFLFCSSVILNALYILMFYISGLSPRESGSPGSVVTRPRCRGVEEKGMDPRGGRQVSVDKQPQNTGTRKYKPEPLKCRLKLKSASETRSSKMGVRRGCMQDLVHCK